MANRIPVDPELAAFLARPPLKHLNLGGKRYPIGKLTPAQVQLFRETWRCRAQVRIHEAFLIIRELLLAGDPAVDWKEAQRHLRIEHAVAAFSEANRQMTAMVVRPEASAGRA